MAKKQTVVPCPHCGHDVPLKLFARKIAQNKRTVTPERKEQLRAQVAHALAVRMAKRAQTKAE